MLGDGGPALGVLTGVGRVQSKAEGQDEGFQGRVRAHTAMGGDEGIGQGE